uniref:Uncharacterized protein n=1 Tax=viral metagenome TaxID=1070528 RepID=A0A6C0F6X2_9ZZZZ|tara:strand:+ start:778 stop:1581 length:804 start_codon:yes stop_codon:yes gene_type:complete
MAMNLELKKFNINEIKDDKVVVLIGKRDTGKSFLCRDILYHHQNIPVGQVISGTEGANQFYQKIVPKLFIHDEFKPDIVSNMLARQKMMIEKMNGGGSDASIDPRAFLILDDCLYDNTWSKDKNMRSVFMNGRHYKLLFLLTMQYALGIPPNLRTNIDYVFILRENYVSNRKRLYEHYAGMFPNFEMFCQVMDQCTENYECLVINNNAKSNKLEDQVFWYKAEPRPDFKIGAPSFWKFSQENFTNEKRDENTFTQKPKNPLKVNKLY